MSWVTQPGCQVDGVPFHLTSSYLALKPGAEKTHVLFSLIMLGFYFTRGKFPSVTMTEMFFSQSETRLCSLPERMNAGLCVLLLRFGRKVASGLAGQEADVEVVPSLQLLGLR